MKTFILLASFLFFLMTAHAQDDDTPAYFRRPLRVQTAAGKEADIADFARTFAHADNVGDWLYSIALARIDGRQPKISQDEQLTYLIDRPHGYLCTATSRKGSKPSNHTLEFCYWHTDTDHRLVAVNRNSNRGTDYLIFYDYNPATELMTPLDQLPFQDFHEHFGELIVRLPREGKDISMEASWSGGPAPLTLRWNGRDGFTLVDAAERYRPATIQTDTIYIRVTFMPWDATTGDPFDLYDAPDGKVIRRFADRDLYYSGRVKRAENGWALIDYDIDAMTLISGKRPKGSGWVRCTNLYVYAAADLFPNYIYAEPTRASRRVATINQAMDNRSDIRWQVLEIRKGWVKIRTNHLGITGWIEARFLCGSDGADC